MKRTAVVGLAVLFAGSLACRARRWRNGVMVEEFPNGNDQTCLTQIGLAP